MPILLAIALLTSTSGIIVSAATAAKPLHAFPAGLFICDCIEASPMWAFALMPRGKPPTHESVQLLTGAIASPVFLMFAASVFSMSAAELALLFTEVSVPAVGATMQDSPSYFR